MGAGGPGCDLALDVRAVADRSGPWDQARLEAAAERALGASLNAVERRTTGPPQWVARHGSPHANRTMSR